MNNKKNTIEQLFSFIKKSPTSYHAAQTTKEMLEANGFQMLQENTPWTLTPGGRYFVTRNLSSVIAFCLPQNDPGNFHITASHSDSPSFKIKENPELPSGDMYVRLNVEKYGGMLMAPWMDRPLSVAGRVLIRNGNTIVTKLVNIDRDLLLIPNLAIHMNRDANNGLRYDPQKDMLPLYGDLSDKNTFFQQIAEATGVDPEQIIGHDLFLYSRTPGTIWGADRQFISCGRLDDLQCAYASLMGLLSADVHSGIAVHCMLDNEEVGSSTKQGAASSFLKDTLTRICICLGKTQQDYYAMLASSFMLSADNAHAVHPNLPEKADPTNRPAMNQGIVIKYNANQKYTTDGVSAAVFKSICQIADVPYQTFLNRSDMAGGSTLGNISNTQVALNTVDIGLSQLSMHSPYETAGAKDTDYLIRAVRTFYESSICCLEDGRYTVEAGAWKS